MTSTLSTPATDRRADTRLAADSAAVATLPSRARVTIISDRQQELLERPIRYIGNEAEFSAHDSWARIMETPEPKAAASSGARSLERAATLLQTILARPLLTGEQEQYLFRQMNYLKFVAEKTRQTLSHEKNEPSKVRRIDELLRHSSKIRERLTEDNLKLVVSIGKQFSHKIHKALSVGIVGLLEAIDTFDYQRGNKLSTFATRPIFWKYLQEARKEKRSSRVVVADLGTWDQPDTSVSGSQHEEARAHQRMHIERGFKHLNAQEREVLKLYFGLHGDEPMTLEEVGKHKKLSKARIQQIKADALKKLWFCVVEKDACPDWFNEPAIVAK